MSYNFVSYAFFVIYALEWQVKCHLANFWACCCFSLKFYYSLYISAVCFSIILFSMTRFALRCCFKLVLNVPKRLKLDKCFCQYFIISYTTKPGSCWEVQDLPPLNHEIFVEGERLERILGCHRRFNNKFFWRHFRSRRLYALPYWYRYITCSIWYWF